MKVKMKMMLDPKYLKSAVLGASDGIVTTFAVVAGVVGAGLSTKVILILGIANMVADGLSMAIGDYLGERSGHKLELEQGKESDGCCLWKTSLVTFVAFIFAGVLPLTPYIVMLFGIDVNPDNQFALSIFATGFAMFTVGSLRTFVTKGKWWLNGLEMLAVGSIAAVVAYSLGSFVEGFLN
jgi:VIT1/CCC1 family predicted Fe2+/Mn2+ transporter